METRSRTAGFWGCTSAFRFRQFEAVRFRSPLRRLQRKTTMKPKFALGLLLCVAATVAAQRPSSSFDRGHSQQAWQNSGFAALIAKCKTPPKPFAIGGGQATPV